jgi:hypothetical protein
MAVMPPERTILSTARARLISIAALLSRFADKDSCADASYIDVPNRYWR